jgi:putative hydrolase of the HAD superfamily
MAGPGGYDAVTFDFWNTLCVPDDERFRTERLAVTKAVFASEGIEVTDDQIRHAMVKLFEKFNETWAANVQFTARDGVPMLIEMVGPELSPEGREHLLDVYQHANRDNPPDLNPNVADTLRILDDAGMRLGIICDVGVSPASVLRGYLEHYDVLHHFDHWSFSDEVGIYKPHREIFEHALTGLGGIEPSRAAHIGDLRRTDVAGAMDMGMLAIRYTGSNDDPGDGELGDLIEADHVIDDHAALPALLGL